MSEAEISVPEPTEVMPTIVPTTSPMTAINARRRVGEGVGGFGGVSGSAHTDGVHTFGDGVAVGRSGRVGQPVFD